MGRCDSGDERVGTSLMLWGKASLNFLFVPWNSPACAHGSRRGPQSKEEEWGVGKDTEFFRGPVYPVVFPGRLEDRKTSSFQDRKSVV